MEPFIGQIMIWAGNYAPKGWAFCEGQLVAIAENPSLFSLLGTTYGGNGTTNFALPDLRGRVAIGMGTGYGLSYRFLGEELGSPTVQISTQQMPAHTHQASLKATSTTASGTDPDSAALASGGRDNEFLPNANLDVNMQEGTVEVGKSDGTSAPIENRQPSITLSYIIALEGIYPSRS